MTWPMLRIWNLLHFPTNPFQTMTNTGMDCKSEGNRYFAQENYEKALECYLEAIHLDSSEAVFFGNAAACYLKLKEYPMAIEMCNEALTRDESMIKAYYRRGIARMQLGELKMALGDLRIASKASVDPGAQKQLLECEKAIKREAFAKAIHVVQFELSEDFVSQIEVEASYGGPRLEGKIDLSFVLEIIEHFRKDKKLHAKYACRILLLALNAFREEPALVDIPKKKLLTICGDTHGQFLDLLTIFRLNGNPSPEHAYLFNGDFVDRGPQSVEVFLTLCAWKALYPAHFFMTRGNHEADTVNRFHGFFEEVGRKFAARQNEMYQVMNQVMNHLPIAYTVANKYFVVHGGIPRADLTLSEIRAITKGTVPASGSLTSQLLWSDPNIKPGINPSHRGEGVLFGADVTETFLKINHLDAIIRSHVWESQGWKAEHDGKCITIFSAPNYIPGTPSPAAYINVDADGELSFHQFDHHSQYSH